MSKLRTGVLAALLLAALLAPEPASAASAPGAAVPASGWPTYHHDLARGGNDAGAAPFRASGPPAARWSVPMDGELNAEPLTSGGRVFQATENNSIYAFEESSGTQVWYRHLAPPVPNPTNSNGCGNIDPFGITGTPVIDATAQVIYAVGMVSAGSGSETYQLFALHLADGTPVTGYPVAIAPAGLNPVYAEQRSALSLSPDGLTVYVTFGGWVGDCTPYHPFVVGVPVGTTKGNTLYVYQPQSSSQNGGGIWAASGAAVDASGNVYVVTGNGFESGSMPCDNALWDHGDGVIKLSPTLTQVSFFAPSNWCELNGSDADMGSIGPILLPNNLLFATGKSGDGWLLDQSNLGGFGPPLHTAHLGTCATADAVFGGMSYAAPYLYVPCDGVGLVALNIDTVNRTFSLAWQSSFRFTPTAPIVAGGVVWTTGGGNLYGFDAVTGSVRFTVPVGATKHFATTTEDAGWVFVPETTRLDAFLFDSQTLGGHLSSDPDAASWTAGRLDVFARGADWALWHRAANAGVWGPWESLGGNLAGSDPGAVSAAPNTVDVFVRGADDAVWHKKWTGSAWTAWDSVGGVLSSGPDAAAMAGGRLDVVVRGADDALWHRTWNGGSWLPWEGLGGVLASDPTIVSWGPGRLDAFVQGADSRLWHRAWNGSAWLGWESLGGILTSAPDASSCSAGSADVFAIGADGGLWRLRYTGSAPGTWSRVGPASPGGPSAVCQPTTTKIDIFQQATDGSLLYQELPS